VTVTVRPEAFTLVFFDATTIAEIAHDLLGRLDLAGRDLRISVDESTPLARISAELADDGSIEVTADSGAFEDTRHPRYLGERAVQTNLGRMLYRVRDRADGSFADAPPDADVTTARLAAWDAYSVGRLGRTGIAVHRPRWLYNFRNRHGFTDTADAAFDRIWAAPALTWAELVAVSDAAVARAA
jgi:hypothetical protein